MPLPLIAETAGAWVLRIGELVDREVDEHITEGTRLPTLATLLAMLTPIVRAALLEAMAESADGFVVPDDLVDSYAAGIVDAMRVTLNRSLRDARRLREQVEQVEPEDLVDDDGNDIPLAGLGVASSIAARLVRRGVKVPDRALMRQDARAPLPRAPLPVTAAPQAPTARARRRQTRIARNVKIPTKTAGVLQSELRTSVAVARNVFGADIADVQGKVMWVRDGRLGPTDKDCEDVDRRYATTGWVRRQPTAHPNCTRMAVPASLPPGERVTLV